MHVAGYDLFATHALGLPEQNDPSPGLDKFPGRPAAPAAVKEAPPAPVAAPAVKHGKKDHK